MGEARGCTWSDIDPGLLEMPEHVRIVDSLRRKGKQNTTRPVLIAQSIAQLLQWQDRIRLSNRSRRRGLIRSKRHIPAMNWWHFHGQIWPTRPEETLTWKPIPEPQSKRTIVLAAPHGLERAERHHRHRLFFPGYLGHGMELLHGLLQYHSYQTVNMRERKIVYRKRMYAQKETDI